MRLRLLPQYTSIEQQMPAEASLSSSFNAAAKLGYSAGVRLSLKACANCKAIKSARCGSQGCYISCMQLLGVTPQVRAIGPSCWPKASSARKHAKNPANVAFVIACARAAACGAHACHVLVFAAALQAVFAAALQAVQEIVTRLVRSRSLSSRALQPLKCILTLFTFEAAASPHTTSFNST